MVFLEWSQASGDFASQIRMNLSEDLNGPLLNEACSILQMANNVVDRALFLGIVKHLLVQNCCLREVVLGLATVVSVNITTNIVSRLQALRSGALLGTRERVGEVVRTTFLVADGLGSITLVVGDRHAEGAVNRDL